VGGVEFRHRAGRRGEVKYLMWLVFAALIALWFVGVIGGIGGGFVHLVLVAAFALIAYRIGTTRMTG
jgi:hypothetical protein